METKRTIMLTSPRVLCDVFSAAYGPLLLDLPCVREKCVRVVGRCFMRMCV
jgi:hypothetical protein